MTTRNSAWRDAYAALIVTAIRRGASYRHIGKAFYVAPNTVAQWIARRNLCHLVRAARQDARAEAVTHLRAAMERARTDATFPKRYSVFRHPAVRRALIAVARQGASLSPVVRACGITSTALYHTLDEESMRAIISARAWHEQEMIALLRSACDDNFE